MRRFLFIMWFSKAKMGMAFVRFGAWYVEWIFRAPLPSLIRFLLIVPMVNQMERTAKNYKEAIAVCKGLLM